MATSKGTPAKGPGEAAARKRSRRLAGVLISIALVGGLVGFFAAMVEDRSTATVWGIGTLPAWYAIVAAVLTAGAMTYGCLRYYSMMDEVERNANWVAGAFGANIILGGYPIWFLLWKGGIVAEPQHEYLYLALSFTTLSAYFWKKFR